MNENSSAVLNVAALENMDCQQLQKNASDTLSEIIRSNYLGCFGQSESCITIIGGGKMATALVNGFVDAGCFDKSRVFICTRSSNTAQQWREKKGFPSAYSHDQFYGQIGQPRGIVLIAVKPQVFPMFLTELQQNNWLRDSGERLLCVSIMAGISLKQFHQQLSSVGFCGKSARIMPNVNCVVSAGTMLITADPEMPREIIDLLITLVSSVGSCIRVDESQFNAASAISGCGPAFISMVLEAIADGGVLSGLSRELAIRLAADMVKGTAQLFLHKIDSASACSNSTSASPAQLKDQVCSPAGTTIAGVRELEKNGIRTAFIEAIYASTKRASELSQ